MAEGERGHPRWRWLVIAAVGAALITGDPAGQSTTTSDGVTGYDAGETLKQHGLGE